MTRSLLAVVCVLCLAAPVCADTPETFNPDEPFEQAVATKFLRSLLNQALDTLEDHVEFSSNLRSEQQLKGDQRTHLRLKFYPEGKSKSNQHFSAEGWRAPAPESGQQEWHFKFKIPDDHSTKSSLQFDTPM
jgi:hypothetical protein